jgi:hypothetical protein
MKRSCTHRTLGVWPDRPHGPLWSGSDARGCVGPGVRWLLAVHLSACAPGTSADGDSDPSFEDSCVSADVGHRAACDAVDSPVDSPDSDTSGGDSTADSDRVVDSPEDTDPTGHSADTDGDSSPAVDTDSMATAHTDSGLPSDTDPGLHTDSDSGSDSDTDTGSLADTDVPPHSDAESDTHTDSDTSGPSDSFFDSGDPSDTTGVGPGDSDTDATWQPDTGRETDSFTLPDTFEAGDSTLPGDSDDREDSDSPSDEDSALESDSHTGGDDESGADSDTTPPPDSDSDTASGDSGEPVRQPACTFPPIVAPFTMDQALQLASVNRGFHHPTQAYEFVPALYGDIDMDLDGQLDAIVVHQAVVVPGAVGDYYRHTWTTSFAMSGLRDPSVDLIHEFLARYFPLDEWHPMGPAVDLDGDGRREEVVFETRHRGRARVAALRLPLSGRTTSYAPTWEFVSSNATTGSLTGARLGDWNGDGQVDLYVLHPESGGTKRGVFLFGPFSPGVVAADTQSDAQIVWSGYLGSQSSSRVGDWNDDGIDDIAFHDPTTLNGGAVGIYFGPLTGVLDPLNPDVRIDHDFGPRPAIPYVFAGGFDNLGDFDGDGDDDFVVSIAHDSTAQTNYRAAAAVFRGPFHHGQRLTNADADALFVGPVDDSVFGHRGLGDVDGDGRADLMTFSADIGERVLAEANGQDSDSSNLYPYPVGGIFVFTDRGNGVFTINDALFAVVGDPVNLVYYASPLPDTNRDGLVEFTIPVINGDLHTTTHWHIHPCLDFGVPTPR